MIPHDRPLNVQYSLCVTLHPYLKEMLSELVQSTLQVEYMFINLYTVVTTMFHLLFNLQVSDNTNIGVTNYAD